MSFSWKGLLGVGSLASGSSSSAAATASGPSDPFDKIGALFDEKNLPWQLSEDGNIPNMLGMRNFGNTCYVNSVIQALYFCRPFRESLLAYSAALARAKTQGIKVEKVDQNLPGPSTSTSESNGATQQQLLEASFYDALRLLFSQMVTAVVKPPPIETTSNITSTASYLASGLSRKSPSKSNTTKSTLGLSSANSLPSLMLAPSITSILPPALALTTPANKAINSCSNIVVQDDDIRQFLAILKKSNALFDTTTHQDAHELLNFILNRIGEDVYEEAKADGRTRPILDKDGKISVVDVTSKGQTWVHRVFEGILTNETKCLTCETVTSRDECFLDLSIDIERNSSVTACLRQFSASEMLCARNKFFCDTCSSLQEAEKRMKVKKLPNVLALHLKRFKYEEALQRFVKLAYRVVFPLELRLFNTSDDAQDPDRLYELFAIIVHIGMGPHHGHYITIVKVGSRWFVFDDETVNIIDEADICRYYGDTPGAGSAYVLFYQAVELNLQDLGLTDTDAEKRRAKEKAQAVMWEHFLALQKAHQPQTKSTEGSGLKVDVSRLPSSLTSPIQASPTTSDTMTNEYRSTGMASAISSSGGLFSRNKNAIPTSPTVTSPNGSEATSESKSSSWFSSLRPGSARKTSMNAAAVLNPPSSSSAAGSSPPTAFKPVAITATIHPDHVEDLDTASISTSSSSRRGRKDSLPNRKDQLHHHIAPKGIPSTATYSDFSHQGASDMSDSLTGSPDKLKASQAAGAAWSPADRPLSKKEQEKIAKQSRRSSISTPTSNNAGITLPPPPMVNGKETSPDRNGLLPGRKGSIRRPLTAEPAVPIIDGQPSFASRRRTTLSRAFGLGRKTDKQ